MRTRLAPLALISLLALAGCSSGSSDDASGSPGSSAGPTVAATGAATPGPTASTTAGPTPGSSPGSTVTVDPSTGATTSPTTGGRASAAPVTTAAPGKPAATKATAPGTYTQDTSGSISSPVFGKMDAKGTQTLTVSALKGDSQTSTVHGDQGDTTEVLLVRDTGTYIASLKLTSPAYNGSKEFRPSPAVLLLPDPAAVGAAWSWGGTSTDGKTKVKTTNKVTRTETLTIGGAKVPCVVVSTHLVLSGDVTYDAQVTTWYAPRYRLPVKDHTVGKGSYSGAMFTTDITSVLRSVKPA